MKIQSKNKKIVSCKLIVPIDGLIEVDANGIADVSPKCAQVLVNNTNDWEYYNPSKQTNEDAKEAETEVEENVSEETSETEGGEEQENEEEEEDDAQVRAEFERKVKNSKVAELKEMCEEGGFPEEEWKDLTKALLIAYLLKKYDEASETSEEEEEEE